MTRLQRLLGFIALLGAAACCAPEPATPPDSIPAAPIQVAEGMCPEHHVPQALCTKCNPALGAVFRARGDWCAEHGFPQSFCPICDPNPTFPTVTGSVPSADAEESEIEARIVRFESSEIEEAAGIVTVAAQRADATTATDCAARVAFDSRRLADVRAIIPGVVRSIEVELGTVVTAGAPLFELESTRVAETQAAMQAAQERLRVARLNLQRQRELLSSSATSTRQVEAAEQELAAAEAEARASGSTLRMAGAGHGGGSGRYILTSPIAGTVVQLPTVLGVLATESTSLATIADPSVMWVLCDIPENGADAVRLGQRMLVTLEGSTNAPLEGNVTWIAAEVDPRTRTVTARADIANPDGRLRANQFARAQIETSLPESAVLVPRNAVQRLGPREIVFVRTAPGTFMPRVVRRHSSAEVVAISGAVREGDAVVTTGAVLLRTEIVPGSIGAGCCEVDSPEGE